MFIFLIGHGIIYNNYFYRAKVNDVYIMNKFSDNGDPFFEKRIDTVRVVNIKDDYIQYINLRYNDTTSSHFIFFNDDIILPKLK